MAAFFVILLLFQWLARIYLKLIYTNLEISFPIWQGAMVDDDALPAAITPCAERFFSGDKAQSVKSLRQVTLVRKIQVYVGDALVTSGIQTTGGCEVGGQVERASERRGLPGR